MMKAIRYTAQWLAFLLIAIPNSAIGMIVEMRTVKIAHDEWTAETAEGGAA